MKTFIGTKGYIGTGSGTGQQFYEYNPATDAWTQKANFGGNVRTEHVAGFSICGKGYMGTGVYYSQKSFYRSEAFCKIYSRYNYRKRDNSLIVSNRIYYPAKPYLIHIGLKFSRNFIFHRKSKVISQLSFKLKVN